MYKPKKGWGIEPVKAAEHHEKVKEKILKEALEKASLEIRDIDIVSFSQGAGLPPCLHVGLEFARELASKYKKSLIPVCHQIAHIEIGRLFTEAKNPVTLYVSGGNTQVISFSEGRYRVFGESLDIAIGNALDKFGRAMGMQFPAGPEIEKKALKGKYINLPYVVKGMDFSFSGIVTEAIKKSKKEKIEDICFSLQENSFAMLTEVSERAMAHLQKEELLLTGGVAANKRLQEMLQTMCQERGAKFYKVPKEFSGDNGAMIAWTGLLGYMSGQRPLKTEEADIRPRWRTDEVKCPWIRGMK